MLGFAFLVFVLNALSSWLYLRRQTREVHNMIETNLYCKCTYAPNYSKYLCFWAVVLEKQLYCIYAKMVMYTYASTYSLYSPASDEGLKDLWRTSRGVESPRGLFFHCRVPSSCFLFALRTRIGIWGFALSRGPFIAIGLVHRASKLDMLGLRRCPVCVCILSFSA